jgi:voltage-gated potassium channel
MDATNHTPPQIRQSYDRRISTYNLCMALLAIISFISFCLIALAPLPDPILTVLRIFDYAVGLIFLADFIFRFIRAPVKWTYLRSWGWLDLLSGIPLPVFSIARMGRLVHVALILRKMRLQDVKRSISSHPARNTLIATAFLSLIVVVIGSTAELALERGHPGANITEGGTALWWAMTTITTVGYGDTYPVTTWGRLTAAVVMALGVVIFGVLSSYLASTFISSRESQNREALIAALQADLDTIKTEMAEIKQLLLQRDQAS